MYCKRSDIYVCFLVAHIHARLNRLIMEIVDRHNSIFRNNNEEKVILVNCKSTNYL